MTDQTVFIPLDRDAVRAWRDGGELTGVDGFAATPELMAALGHDELSREDAEFAAQSYAAVDTLLRPEPVSRRWVLAAAVPAADCSPGQWPPYGAVRVATIDWARVLAIFVDDAAAEESVRETSRAVADMDLPGAWDHPSTEELVAEHDLLWYLPTEFDQIP
ncbi:MAG: DUF6912 family protein [Propionibacteriaceae bacterium]